MQSSIEKYNRYLGFFQQNMHSSSQDLQLQSLMHTLPTNTTSNQTNLIGILTQSSAIRNSYIHPTIGNDNNDQIKSAFKPVKPRISINPIPTNLPEAQSNNLDLSMHSSPINSKNSFETVPHSIYASSYESHNQHNHTNSSGLENVKKNTKSLNWSTTYEKTPKKNENNFRMAYKYVADRTGHVGAVYHWDTLLPVLPEERTYKALPTRQKATRIQQRQKLKTFHHQITQFVDNTIPIIDLTSEQEQNDKFEETVQNLKLLSKTYQTNKTPPIDINKTADNSNDYLSSISEPNLNEIEFKTNVPSKDKISMKNHKMESANFRYSNGIRVPPKKQIKLTAKHNQLQKQIRTYNGFRLFARRNQSYAKEHANESDSESIVNSVLVKWWDDAGAKEKERYAQVAEVIIENQSRSTSAVATSHGKKIQNDSTVSEQINTNQECDKSSNELPTDIVYKKNTDTEIDPIVSGAKSSNRENKKYSPDDNNENNSFFRTSLNSINKFIK